MTILDGGNAFSTYSQPTSTLEPDFLELMPLTCGLMPNGASNGIIGEFADTTSITPHCHLEYKTQTIMNAEGVEKQQLGICYLDGVYEVNTEWKLTIPIPGGEREVKIISVDQNTDERGFHHTAVRFGAL